MKKLLFGLILVTNIYAGHWQCYAENNHGEKYWGAGYTKYEASHHALKTCRWDTGTRGRCWVINYCDWVPNR
jgi:hypothetical protein